MSPKSPASSRAAKTTRTRSRASWPGFIPDILDQNYYDDIIHVSTEEAFAYQKKLAAEQGIFVGISAGAAAAAGAKLAERREFAGKNIVVILPDTGERYLSMLNFDEE